MRAVKRRPLLGVSSGAACVASSLALAAVLTPLTARADPPVRGVHVEPPPAPEDREPVLGVEVHVAGVAPLVDEALCPVESRCVFGGGGGVGGSVERRFASGLAVALGYDAWFVDAAGVYEIGVLQLLRAAVRYIFFPTQALHLVADIGLGGIVFGETFRVSSAGGAVQIGVGAELEVTHAIAFTAGVVTRFFTASAFTTATDHTERGGAAVNAALAFQAGIQIVEP